MKHKKILLSIIAIILAFSLSACGGDLKGTYKYQENYYLVFSGSNKVEWHENSMVFEGTYKKTDEGYHLTIQGSGIVPTQEFDVTVTEDGSLIINGKTFKKETKK